MSNNIQKLIKHSKNPRLIEEAFEFAKQSYQNEKWLTGENYVDHALRLALVLQNLGVEEKVVIAGLLHHTLNALPTGQEVTLKTIEKKFGKDIADLAKKASRLNRVYYSIALDVKENKASTEQKIENIRKMFFAIAKDIRVILIKLAARIDGMDQLKQLPEPMQKIYAIETIKIFAPIANRLGLGGIKAKLEDMAFEYLYPAEFTQLKTQIQEKSQQNQAYLKRSITQLKKLLAKEKIQYLDINYRLKSYWSTYQKLLKRDMDFSQIYDLVALRIIVKDISTCYKLLGIIHKRFPPISGQIQDYIAKPKENGYKSIHTTVYLEEKTFSEIQIRTLQMHQEAEHGVCAHWAYKEKIDLHKAPEHWAKEIPDFWKTVNINFFENQVFAFTPKGDVIVLPKEATAIDFAYALHSDIGNHCESAKIDGKIIPLSQPLTNGDVVEIITNKKKNPSQDWLRVVKTNFAKSHIRKLLTAIPVSIFSVPSFVGRKISEISKKALKRDTKKIPKESPTQIYLAGHKDMLVHIGKCCNAKPGDPVKAYLTIHRSAVLHKSFCNNLQKIAQKFPEKIIEASWNKS